MRSAGVLAAVLASILASLLPAASRADFLSDYLSDKTFGADPGPCPGPTINDDVCTGDVANMPESVKKIRVCLVKGFSATCDEIGDMLQGGVFTIWNLQCDNVQVADIELTHVVESSNQQITSNVDVQNFKIGCTGDIRVELLHMEIIDVVDLIVTFEGPFSMSQTADMDGVTLSLEIDFFTDSGVNLNTDLPDNIRIPYEQCDIEPELGLELSAGTEGFQYAKLCLFNDWFSWIDEDAGCTDNIEDVLDSVGADNILNLIATIAEGVLGGVVCQLLEEAAWLEDYNEPGIINEVWLEVKAQIDEWGESVGQDVEAAEQPAAILATQPYSGVTSTMIANSIDYSTDTVVESVSVMLNNWLGSPSTQAKYDDGPVINELIDLLTEPDGTFPLDLEAYDAAVEVQIPLNVSDITVRLQRLSVQGLNTLKTFKVLDIGTELDPSERLQRTFNNSLVIGELVLEVETYLRFDRGDWVTASCNLPPPGTCASDSSEFTFNFTVTVHNVDFAASLLALINPDEIVDLQVGQILGIDFEEESFGAFSKILRCVSPAAYALNVTNFEASIGEITDPDMVNFDGEGLSTLIRNAVALGADVAKGALRTKFPGIANGPLRELVNEILLEDVTLPGQSGTQSCPAYDPANGPGELDVDFDGAVFSPVYALVNDGIGGERITDTEVDLNNYIDELLKFNEASYESFPLTSTGEDGEWALKEEYNSAGILYRFNDTEDFVQFSDFVIGNLDSLYKLTLASPGDGLDIGFGLGGALFLSDGETLGPDRPLELSLKFTADVPSKGIDETARLTLALEEFDLDITMTKLVLDLDLIYALYFNELDRIPCLLAALNDIRFEREASQASIESLTFQVSERTSASTSSNKIEDALATLAGEQPQARARALITTLADVAMDMILDVIEEIPGEYANLTAVTCVDEETTVDDVMALLSIDLPNITQIMEECTGEIAALPTIEETEDIVYKGGELPNLLNFQESFVIDVLQGALGILKGETLQNVFTALGNTSGNALSDLFELDDPEDPTNGNVTLVFPLDKLNLGLDYKSEDPGFEFNPGNLRIRSFNRLLDTFTLLEPIGTMTTRHTLNFDRDIPLDLTIEPWIELDGEAAGEAAGSIIREDIVIAMRVTQLTLIAEIVTAFDWTKLLDLTLSQLLAVGADQSMFLADHAIDCWMSTYYEDGLFLRQLEVSLGQLDGVTLTSTQEILSEGVEQMVGAIIELATYFYVEAIPRLVQNCAVPYVNEVLTETLEIASCPDPDDIAPPPLAEGNTVLRFDTSPGLNSFLDFWFTDVVSENYGSLNTILNGAAADLTFFDSNSKAGDQSFNFTLPLVYNGVSYGTLFLGIEDLTIGNLGSFRDLRPLVPFGSDRLPKYDPSDYTTEDRRRLVTSGQQPFTTQTNIDIEGPLELNIAKVTINAYDLFEGYPAMVNELKVTLAISDLIMGLQLLLGVDLVKLLDVRFRSFASLEEIPCLLIPVEQLEPLDFNLTTSFVQITASCAGTCDFPLINYLEGGDEFTNENGDEISSLIDEFITYWTGFVETKGAQQLIDGAISQAEDDCAAIYELVDELTTFEERNRQDAASVFAYIFLGGCAFAGLGTLCLVPLHRRRQKRTIEAKLVGSKPYERDEYFAGEMALTELRAKSIFQHPITPIVPRFLIPFIQIMNVAGLVLAIGFSDAANITLELTIFGATTQTIALVPFTLFSTINDTWNSGAWPLAALIAVASCMWPIAKNLVLLFLWFAPSTIVSAKRRRFALEVLDMLGKWSFLDVFVIVITLAALRTYVVGAFYGQLAFLDDEVFIAEVNVVPESGLVLLCFVAALSLLINHVVMFYHDKVEESNQRSEDRANGNHDIARKIPRRATVKYPIWKHEFTGTTRSGLTRAVRPAAAYALLATTFVAFLLIVIGINLPLITFELRGLLGILLEVLSEDSPRLNGELLNKKTYSVVSMGAALAESPTSTAFEAIYITFFKILYAIATYVGPVTLLLMQTALFTAPLNLNTGRSIFFWTKIASYWSGLEIFMVAMVLTILEISIVMQFITDFITNDVCSQVSGAIELLVEDADLDGFCFNAVGTLEPTSALLFAGSVLELGSFYVITVVASAVLADRYYDAYNGLRSDVKPHRMLRINRWILAKCTTLKRPSQGASRGAVDPSSPAGPGFGAGPFAELDDQDDNDLIDQEDMWCGPCKRLCANEKGQRTAEARIDAWQSRFAVASEVTGRESGNPAFAGAPQRPRFRRGSADSIEV